MISGTTRSGFTFEVPEDIANDMELFECLVDMDSGDVKAVVPVVRRVLGAQKQALYNHLRNENGRVPIEAVAEEIIDIINAAKGGKK